MKYESPLADELPTTPMSRPPRSESPRPPTGRAGAANDGEQARASRVEEIEPREASTFEDVYDVGKTREGIESTEVEGYEGARVFVGMKSKEAGRASEDFVIAFKNGVGVADGVGQSSKGVEPNDIGLTAAAQASRIFSSTVARYFKMPGKSPAPASAAEMLGRSELIEINPDIAAQQEFYIPMHPVIAARMADQLIASNPEAARTAADLVRAVERGQEEVAKLGGGQTTACLVVRQGEVAIFASVGNSVGFIQRPGGEIIQVTRENTLKNLFLDAGGLMPQVIKEMRADKEKTMTVTEDESGHPKPRKYTYRQLSSKIMGAIGGDPEKAKPALSIVHVAPGTRLFTITDGILDKFRDADGRIDTARLTQCLGRSEDVPPEDQIKTTMTIAERERTPENPDPDDMGIGMMDVE